MLVGTDGTDRSGQARDLQVSGEHADDFWRRLEKPRAFARDVGAGLGEYLCRSLSHRAALVEPKDLAWLLASYARDGLARVEAVGDAPPLVTVRSALEEALGMRFEGERGERFFRSTLIQTLFYGIFSAWVLWSREEKNSDGPLFAGRYNQERFNWRESVWHLRAPVLRALFQQLSDPGRLRAARSSSRCWTGRRRRLTAWTGPSFSRGSTKARRCRTSTSRSSKLSTPHCASSWASGTRQPKWSATWWPAWTGR